MCKSLSEKLGSTLKLVMLLLLLTNAKNVGAQTGVEDLPAPRIAVKTNLPYWLTLSPNIGAEVGITDHITVDLEGGMNKINSMLMASANLDSLTELGSDMEIIPQENVLPVEDSEENVFNGRGLDW